MTESTHYLTLAESIFRHAVAAVQPALLIRKNVQLDGEILTISRQTIDLTAITNLYVIGAGKAAAPMAQAVEEILGNRITDGIVIVKDGHTAPLQYIRAVEASHPVPDERGLAGTAKLRQLIEKAGEEDLVICLLSGGGSALLIDTPPGCSLPELQHFFKLLLASGADITEMNTVRKHLSAVKGGGLLRSIYPARLISLILSDVIGDPLDVIASGPTVADATTFADAYGVIEKYRLPDQMPASVWTHLQKGLQGAVSDTPKAGDPVVKQGANYLIGSNALALQAARASAEAFGFHAHIITDQMRGEAREVALTIVAEANKIAAQAAIPKPVCLLWGGETTVTLRGNGQGGRNQELALAAAIALKNQAGIVLLAAGTDGTDGPTDAAGAVIDGFTILIAEAKGLSAEAFLADHDSYSFFRQAGGHILTGPTLTNVMDIVIALVY